mmetsp:Transcript_22490/g.33724  ORF Transcript_22490/g.33724 Transcript_22490/m.33724 type:complete len:236 (-) Transcript_22490:636-1343(-)
MTVPTLMFSITRSANADECAWNAGMECRCIFKPWKYSSFVSQNMKSTLSGVRSSSLLSSSSESSSEASFLLFLVFLSSLFFFLPTSFFCRFATGSSPSSPSSPSSEASSSSESYSTFFNSPSNTKSSSSSEEYSSDEDSSAGCGGIASSSFLLARASACSFCFLFVDIGYFDWVGLGWVSSCIGVVGCSSVQLHPTLCTTFSFVLGGRWLSAISPFLCVNSANLHTLLARNKKYR